MSRFSVKKPLTVFVCVVLILVLGIVSFTGISTDLLPNMNLPYVIAVTAYPGASPEKVETSVSKPIESELATTNGVKDITSVSSENISMVMLEFEQDTNMDTAMIELSTAINTVSGQFDDGIGTPTLVKISPDLLPIMVGGIDKEGLSEEELSSFINENIIPELEKVDGVASVEASGLVEKSISIELDDDKIEKINDKLLKAVNKELYEAKSQIDDGLAEIESGEKKLEEAQKSFDDESGSAAVALADASAQVDAATAAVAALESQITILAANKSALETELSAMKQLDSSKEALESLAQGIVSSVFAAKMPEVSGAPTAEQQAQMAQIQKDMQTALEDPAGYIKDNITDSQFTTLYAQVLSAAGDSVSDEMINMSKSEFLQTYETAQNAQSRISEIDSELNNLATEQAVLDAMQPQLEKNSKKAQNAYKKLEKQKITAVTELSSGEIQLSETKQSLQSAKSELESAKEEYESSRDTALKAADLSGNITADTVSQILTAQNFSMPAGSIDEDGLESHVVKVDGEYTSLKEIKNTVLMYVDQGSIGNIKLKDIANVTFTDNSGESYSKINSNPAVIFTVQKQSTASTSDVSDALGEKIENLQAEYDGLSVTSLMDQGTYIHMVINSVLENLIWGGLLAVLVLALFLRDVKPTVIIAFSIPISLLFAIVLMYFTDVTMNIISLSGLALGVGMLVDNSIVVIENIYRLRNQGVSAARAAVMGAREVAGAITASTLTTICVFVPIVFTQGMTREIFTDMGLTIGYSLAASLLVALTVVPAMGSRIFRAQKEKQHKWFDGLINVYERALRAGLKHKIPVIALAVVLLGLSVFGATQMGTAFIPESEQSQLQASISFPTEYTKLDVREATDDIAKQIQDIDGVKTVGTMESSASTLSSLSGSSSGNSMTCYIELESINSSKNEQIEKQITQITDEYGCETSVTGSSSSMMSLGDSGVEIVITGDELQTIYDIADDLALKLKAVDGLENISNGRDDSDTQTVISIDKAAAMKYNLTVAQVYQSIAGALSGKTESTTVTINGEDYPIVITDSSEKVTDDNLMEQTISYTDSSGETKEVALGDISESSETESPDSITRENSQRTLSVTAEVDAEHNIGLVSRDVEKILADYELPDGYTAEIAGENETITEAFGDMYLMLLLAVVFIYLIMVAQFQSFISPFIVIFTIPLAVTGGLLGLWITGSELSVVALIGFLVLCGVVVNNGIVFVDYTNRLREQGMSKREALVQTGRTRIRPILMTALTTILAMTTMALGIGEGADITAPVGIVVIGGLLYATLLTLFIVPVLYDLIGKKKIKVINVDSDDMEDSGESYRYDK